MAEDRDYLVIFEEPDPYGLPSDDALVLDVEQNRGQSMGAVDVQQRVDIELTNTTNRLGTLGFIVACLGGLMGVALMATFATIYPDQWYGDDGNISDGSIVKNLLAAAVATTVLLTGGMVLTYYGRRIQARGNLAAVRIVEKSAQPRMAFEQQ